MPGMSRYPWRVTAPSYYASGNDVEPVDVLNLVGCAVLSAGEHAKGVIERDGRLWRELKWASPTTVRIERPTGTWVVVTPMATA